MYVHLAMSGQTNPRKVYNSGNSTVISLPKEFRREAGIDVGDKYVLEETENGFKATEVELRVAGNG